MPHDVEEWGVGEKRQDGRAGFYPDAVVDFRAGNLWRAGKEWYGRGGKTDVDLAEALYRLARNFKDQRHIECTLDTRDDTSELGESKHVALMCGGKLLDVSIFEGPRPGTEGTQPGIGLWEYLAPR